MISDRRQVFEDRFVSSQITHSLPALGKLLSLGLLVLIPVLQLSLNILELISLPFIIILLISYFIRSKVLASKTDTALIIKALIQPWRWVVAINLCILLGFTLIWHTLTDRYAISLCLLLLVFIPVSLTQVEHANRIFPRSWKKLTGVKIICVLFAILLFTNAVEGLDRSSSKLHLKSAGQWLMQYNPNNQGYKSSKIYSNSRIIDYYSGRQDITPDQHYGNQVLGNLAFSTRLSKLDYLVVDTGKSSYGPGISFYRNFRDYSGKEPDMIFQNHKGQKVFIYDLTTKQ